MKTLREQMKECIANGNLIEIDVSDHQYVMLPGIFTGVKNFIPVEFVNVCLKHKKACSGKCPERKG